MNTNIKEICLNHKEEAIFFCQECRMYLCNKCERSHNEFFKNIKHHLNQSDKNKDKTEIFTGLCQEQNHFCELEFFCKTHNKLVCAKCITKIKKKIYGNHSDCNLYLIEEIENEIKNKLYENIKILENSSVNLVQLINEIKKLSEKLNENKEELKIKIQKLFTKIRNSLNDREEQLLLEVDDKYDKLILEEKIVKQIDNLQNRIKFFVEKGNNFKDYWNNNKLNSLINDYLNIDINVKVKENLFKNENINFLGDNEINDILKTIKNFGKIDNKKGQLFSSNIIFDQELVLSWLNNKNFVSELLFRKSRDGSTPMDFHNKCDNKGFTITFIETTNGYKFGGYTEL